LDLVRTGSTTAVTEQDVTRWLSLALLLPLAWWTLSMGSGAATWCFLDYVNLAFHEAGHLVFRPLGTTLHYLGGTLGQLLVPLILAATFLLRERKPFAAAVCLWWTGESLINISIYMADARELSLPLVGGGDHDWNELFFRFGLLSEPPVRSVSSGTHVAGVIVMLLGLAWAGQFLLPDRLRWRLRHGLTLRFPWLERFL
jgi:hypothetical protein